MIDKILKLIKTFTDVKKVCVFCIAFAAVLAMTGWTAHENTEQSIPVSAQAEENDAVEIVFAAKMLPDPNETIKDKRKIEVLELPAVPDEKESSRYETKSNVSSLAAKPGGFVYSDKIPMSYELQEYTYEKCIEHGLEYELVLAIMWRESRFKTDAVNTNSNGTKDNGIMQINDINRQWLYEKYGIDNLMDPYQNINAGTAMLGTFASKYGEHGALMAYQYGESGMARKLRQGQTTSRNIELAYNQRDYYRKLYVS